MANNTIFIPTLEQLDAHFENTVSEINCPVCIDNETHGYESDSVHGEDATK